MSVFTERLVGWLRRVPVWVWVVVVVIIIVAVVSLIDIVPPASCPSGYSVSC